MNPISPTPSVRLSAISLVAVPGRDDTTEVLGQTDAGRLLPSLVVTQASDGRDVVVTARDMTTAEKRTFGERSR